LIMIGLPSVFISWPLAAPVDGSYRDARNSSRSYAGWYLAPTPQGSKPSRRYPVTNTYNARDAYDR
jgi:hypothetical protein